MTLETPQPLIAFKEPLQERSKKTKRNILEAARDIFAELGYENATTHQIAQRAQLSIGGVYAHFRNKEEIFLMVLEERSKNAYTVTRECVEYIRSQGMDIEEGIDHLFSAIYSFHTKYGKLNFEINRFVTLNEKAEAIHDYWEKEEERVITKWFMENPDRFALDDLKIAMIVMGRATHAVFHYLYKNRDRVGEQDVLSQLVTMFKRYLIR
jgi:AcrR family transcriptional regulator